MSVLLREKALLFGATRSLVGVLTEPPRDVDTRGKPGVLLLNSGLLHRVGPHRMYVQLARALAAQGFPVLRFDFSGIGDSAPRTDAVSGDDSTLEEAREAMEALTSARGVRRFVLMGLCSGADNAFQIARRDERVVGAVMIDGYAYRTFGFYWRFLTARLTSRQTWIRQLRHVVRRIRRATPDAPQAEAMYVREFPPREQVIGDCRAMIGRGVELCFLHSAGQYQYYNYRAQFADSFGDLALNPHITSAYFPEANHLFTRRSHLQLLVARVAAWMPCTVDSAATTVAETQPAARLSREPVLADAPAVR
jgi:pimeloyl-ACP methyl ester carboxylesterase